MLALAALLSPRVPPTGDDSKKGARTVLGARAVTVLALVSLAGLAIVIWAFVELGCLRGTVGANQYGPDRLAAPLAPMRTAR